MLLELGNERAKLPDGSTVEDGTPRVTYLHIPEDIYPLGVFDEEAWRAGEVVVDPIEPASVDVGAVAQHLLATDEGGVTHLPGLEPLLVVAHHRHGVWANHGAGAPSWVHSDTHPEFAELVARMFGGVAVGRPDGVEDTHWTLSGPPGRGPATGALDLNANITQNGRDIWARALGGGQVGDTGQATASGATSLTDSTKSGTWTSNQWAGCRVFASVSATQMVFGIIVSNTTTVLTVDRWYTVGTPGGAAGSTPSATGTYVITDGNAPAWFMGLTANNGAPASPSTATSLTGEITTVGGGLIRKICPYAHTASQNTYTLTPVFTANGSDSLSVVIAKIGVFDSMVPGDTTSTMLFESLLSATATLSASGDQLTVTETVTGT